MRETRGMGKCCQAFRGISSNIPGNVAKHSGECRQIFQGMSSDIPGNVAKHSGEYSQTFQGMSPMFGVNEENCWAESHLESC